MMGDPKAAVWSIEGDAIYEALLRVEEGIPAEFVWLELCAATEVETVGGE